MGFLSCQSILEINQFYHLLDYDSVCSLADMAESWLVA